MNALRTLLYAIARAIGDYQAVKRGRIAQRLQRRALGRLLSRIFRP
jgi:hypothetical protein